MRRYHTGSRTFPPTVNRLGRGGDPLQTSVSGAGSGSGPGIQTWTRTASHPAGVFTIETRRCRPGSPRPPWSRSGERPRLGVLNQPRIRATSRREGSLIVETSTSKPAAVWRCPRFRTSHPGRDPGRWLSGTSGAASHRPVPSISTRRTSSTDTHLGIGSPLDGLGAWSGRVGARTVAESGGAGNATKGQECRGVREERGGRLVGVDRLAE